MDFGIWVSVVATIVAVASAAISMHNSRLSMRPVLALWEQQEGESWRYLLSNKGNGPAMIDDIKIKIDGALMNETAENLFENSVYKLFENAGVRDSVEVLYTSYMGKGQPFGRDDQITLFEINLDRLKLYMAGFSSQKELFDRCEMTVIYRDMFNEKWQTSFTPDGTKASRCWGEF